MKLDTKIQAKAKRAAARSSQVRNDVEERERELQVATKEYPICFLFIYIYYFL
jgi:hypothetical protein